MKKILPTIVLGVLLVTLFVPIITSAQGPVQGPYECCKARATFNWTTGKINNKDCTKTPPPKECKINKGETIGPTDPAFKCPLPNKEGNKDQRPDKWTDDWGVICMMNTVYTATNWVFYILTLIVVIMIIWGGFTYLTAAGNPEAAGKGKTIILYALIGLAIALFAKVIPSIVKFVMGV